jgi:hypothetical protein
MHSAAVMLSLTVIAKRHVLNPWAYLHGVFTRLLARPTDADLTDLPPAAGTRPNMTDPLRRRSL